MQATTRSNTQVPYKACSLSHSTTRLGRQAALHSGLRMMASSSALLALQHCQDNTEPEPGQRSIILTQADMHTTCRAAAWCCQHIYHVLLALVECWQALAAGR